MFSDDTLTSMAASIVQVAMASENHFTAVNACIFVLGSIKGQMAVLVL